MYSTCTRVPGYQATVRNLRIRVRYYYDNYYTRRSVGAYWGRRLQNSRSTVTRVPSRDPFYTRVNCCNHRGVRVPDPGGVASKPEPHARGHRRST
eukprot:95759-Rhodomonas_salina.1